MEARVVGACPRAIVNRRVDEVENSAIGPPDDEEETGEEQEDVDASMDLLGSCAFNNWDRSPVVVPPHESVGDDAYAWAHHSSDEGNEGAEDGDGRGDQVSDGGGSEGAS